MHLESACFTSFQIQTCERLGLATAAAVCRHLIYICLKIEIVEMLCSAYLNQKLVQNY